MVTSPAMVDHVIYEHALPPTADLLAFLRAHLPHSIPLLRCLQFPGGLSKTSTLLASFPPLAHRQSHLPAGTVNGSIPSTVQEVPTPFLVGFFDRSRRPGTQAYMFSSAELASTVAVAEDAVCDGEHEALKIEMDQILSMFAKFARLSPYVNSAASSPTLPVAGEFDGRRTLDERLGEDIIVLGSLHATLRDRLSAHPSRCVRDDLEGPGGPFQKYIIPLGALRTERAFKPGDPISPTKDLVGCTLQPADFDFVVSQNSYVRSPQVLLGLPNCGIRSTSTGRLIAFAFLGADGSLKALHVEPEWRGMGLGGLLATSLLVHKNAEFTASKPAVQVEGRSGHLPGSCYDTFREKQQQDIAHGEVALSNVASIRLFQKLGARAAWQVYWARIDLGRAAAYV